MRNVTQNRAIRVPASAAALAAMLLMSGGCAVKQALDGDPRDPWERYNRSVFAFNEAADKAVIKPVASAYRTVLPEPARRGIANMFSNVGEVPNVLNNLLQGDFAGAGSDLLRFLINTTLGVFGLFDPASSMGLVRNEEDFGQTLAVWGVGPGPYFVLPLLGPSTLRDAPALAVSFLLYPLHHVEDTGARNALITSRMISNRAAFLEREKILRDLSPDFYRELRGFYLNRREHLVRDGATEVDEELYEDL